MESIVIKTYVDKLLEELHLTKKDFIGVFVYGSYVSGRESKLSDLDVMIVRSNYETADCGSKMIDGIRIEYFIQDLRNLYARIKEEIEQNNPSHLTKFATGEVLYDYEGKVLEFIQNAKALYETNIKGVLGENEYFGIFSINNRIEDLEALIDCESFYAVYYVTLEKIRTLYERIYGCIELPIMKIEKIYRNEEFARSYIFSDVHRLPDKEFIRYYLDCLKVEDTLAMFEKIKRLFSYSFGSIDFDPNNFVLKFKKNPPFRV